MMVLNGVRAIGPSIMEEQQWNTMRDRCLCGKQRVIVDATGKIVREVKIASEPEHWSAISANWNCLSSALLRGWALIAVAAYWAWGRRTRCGFARTRPVKALWAMTVKTDGKMHADAQLLRMGWYCPALNGRAMWHWWRWHRWRRGVFEAIVGTQPVRKENGGTFPTLVRHALLGQHEAAGRGESRNQMQRSPVFGLVVAAA